MSSKERPFVLVITGLVLMACAIAIVAVGCTDSPTSPYEFLPWVQADGLAGTDTTDSCEVGGTTKEVTFNGHLDGDSIAHNSPDICWEYDALDTFNFDIDFAFNENDHPTNDYYILDKFYFATGKQCDTSPATEGTFVERLASIYHGHDGGPTHSFTESDIEVPTGAECVYLGIRPGVSADTSVEKPGSNYDLHLRLWTKLDADAPTNFTAVRTGEDIDLDWTNQESLPTSIQRRLVSPSSTDWAELAWEPVNDSAYTDTRSQADAGKVFRYRVQHRKLSAIENTARLGDRSDSVSVTMPNDVTTSINTGPTSVKPNQYCTWSTSTSGGTTPYVYAWSGGASGASADYLGALSSSDTLIFTVTDSISWQAVDSIGVTVSSQAANCPGAVFSSITGPTTVRRNQECLWLGAGSGGTTPYDYAWSGDASGSSTSFQGSFSSAATLIFTVTDDIGRIAVDTIQVTIDPGADECEIK
jgi:hypothetical protein